MAGVIITPRHFAKKNGVFQPIGRPNNGWIGLCANGMSCAPVPHRIPVIFHLGPGTDSGTLSPLLRLFKQVGGLLLRAGRRRLSVSFYAFVSRLPALFYHPANNLKSYLKLPAGQCSVP